MSKKIKFLAAALLTVVGFVGVQMNNEGKAVPAYGCVYTGKYSSSCFYGGYEIVRCQFGARTSCCF